MVQSFHQHIHDSPSGSSQRQAASHYNALGICNTKCNEFKLNMSSHSTCTTRIFKAVIHVSHVIHQLLYISLLWKHMYFACLCINYLTTELNIFCFNMTSGHPMSFFMQPTSSMKSLQYLLPMKPPYFCNRGRL